MRSVLCLLLLAVAGAAYACRCEQRLLADYFNLADEVVMARLTGWDTIAGDVPARLLRLSLVVPPYKESTASGGAVGDARRYLTADHSAGCGLAPEIGATYLLFARGDGGTDRGAPLQVDSCSGSRVFLHVEGGEPVGFRDVPARFVVQQLNGLAGLQLLRRVASQHPVHAADDNDTLIGLLDVAGFSHAGSVMVFERPDRASIRPRSIAGYDDLETRELAYEVPAAVVYARIDGWYRLRLKDAGFVWLPPEYAGSFVPYADLPLRRLAYIRLPWHGFIWPGPGAGLPVRALALDGRREQPVAVLESSRIGDSLWFRIELLDASPCDGGAPRAAHAGWVPAYRDTGDPLIWYYSRGC